MKRFLVLFVGALITSVGSGMTAFGLATWAFGHFGNATAVTLIALCSFGPLVLLAPLGGWAADRFDRRLMMVVGDTGSILGLLAVMWLVTLPEPPLAGILAGVGLASCFAALTEPALRASVTDLVEPDDYGRSSGLLQMAGAAKFLISPVAAGLVLRMSSLHTILLIDMATTLVTICCSLYVRRCVPTSTRSEPEPLGASLRDGWRQLASRPPVVRAVAIMSLLCVALGFLQVLVKPVLLPHYSVAAVGTAESATAVGMLTGAVAVAMSKAKNPVVLMRIGICGVAVAMGCLALQQGIVWITACCFLACAFLGPCNTAADLVVRSAIPNSHQGRAYGLISLLSQSGMVLAFAVAGPLADLVVQPWLRANGALASTMGAIVGLGPGRGAALVISLAGVASLFLLPWVTQRSLGIEARPTPE